MRVYFHLRHAQEQILDHEGAEVSDLNQAFAQALRAIEEFRKEDSSLTQDLSGWTLAVGDGNGAVLLRIDLDADINLILRNGLQ